MPAASPTPSFPGAWPDSSSSDVVPPLPDKYVSRIENGDTPQDISPSLICLSPRPIPELPSLSSSLSTADSSETDGASTPPEPPEQPCSPVEVQPACTPLQTHLPVVLDLREPHSPDSAHFSPAIDSTSFPSPSSSRLQLSLSNNCPGSRSFESIATYLPSPSSPDDEQGATQDEQARSIPTKEETTDPHLQGDQQEYSPHPAKISIGKRTFLSRVKRFGGRVRKLFKPRVVETRARHNSVTSLVSPRKSSLPVSLRLASESAGGHQGPEAQYFIPRRFSLQSLLHSRMPSGSGDSNSRATAGNRLSTIVSAQDDDWPSVHNTRPPNAATADVAGIDHHETGITAD
jgi:hypothetical protein